MKLPNKHKGKVHPSPSSSPLPSPSPAATKDPSSALKLLPAAILALISVLSLEDQEVLAYMITRSLEATDSKPRRRRAKQASPSSPAAAPHAPPVFHCGCFDCYTCYWFRWDSSPNRDLIHHAIEAFEDHLTTGEPRKRGGRARKKSDQIPAPACTEPQHTASISPDELPESVDFAAEEAAVKAEEGDNEVVGMQNEEVADVAPPPEAAVDSEEETTAAGTGGGHKGLARKVLPDVIGLFNSRLWSLWSPNA